MKLCFFCGKPNDFAQCILDEAKADMRQPLMYILDADGNPVPVEDADEWSLWYGTADRVVAQTQIGKFGVSTVFLGIDHNFYGGPPLVFETAVFHDLGDDVDFGFADIKRRYSTRAEALAGHQQICDQIEAIAR